MTKIDNTNGKANEGYMEYVRIIFVVVLSLDFTAPFSNCFISADYMCCTEYIQVGTCMEEELLLDCFNTPQPQQPENLWQYCTLRSLHNE